MVSLGKWIDVDSNLTTWGVGHVGHGYQPLNWDDHPGPYLVATPRWYRDWILCTVGLGVLQTKRCLRFLCAEQVANVIENSPKS